MKASLLSLFIFCMLLSACNNSPKEDQQTTTSTADSTAYGETLNGLDSLMLNEPIVFSARHHFSDSLSQDSFVASIGAGTVVWHNAVKEFCYIRIYDNRSNLLFEDSVSPAGFYNTDISNVDNARADLKRGMAAIFDNNNFSVSGQNDIIKNASADQIKNMATWNEAINDSTRVVFTYFDGGTQSCVSYCQKLKKVAIAVQTYSEAED